MHNISLSILLFKLGKRHLWYEKIIFIQCLLYFCYMFQKSKPDYSVALFKDVWVKIHRVPISNFFEKFPIETSFLSHQLQQSDQGSMFQIIIRVIETCQKGLRFKISPGLGLKPLNFGSPSRRVSQLATTTTYV